MEFKDLLKNRRHELGLTLAEVGNSVGVAKATVQRWESGNIKNIKKDKIYSLSQVLKTTPEYLMGWDTNNYMATIAERIKEGMSMQNMRQSDLVRLTGIGKSSISTYISGEYEPKQKNIYKIAKALNVNEAWLMGKDVPSNRIDIGIPAKNLLPIVGVIRAGMPILAQENIEGYYPAPVNNIEEHFYLRVSGDSMINAGIKNKSLVLIKKQNTAEDGQIVACRVNGDEATLKRFKHAKDTIVLMPENSDYQPIIISQKDFETGYAEIIGVAISVVTKL